MSSFKVETKKLRGECQALTRYQKSMRAYAERTRSVARRAFGLGSEMAQVRAKITSAAAQMETQRRLLADVKDTLLDACTFYETAENTILNPNGKGAGAEIWKHFVELIGEGGCVGATLSAVLSGITGDGTLKSTLEITKSSVGALEKLLDKDLVSAKSSYKNWLGLNVKKYATRNNTTSWGKAFSKNLKDGFSDEIKGLTDFKGNKAATVCKWGGVFLTAGIAAVDNIEEYKSGEITAGRAVAETVMETGVGIVTGIAITAAVGTVMASAPVILVGAATAAVTWGLDAASQALFGKEMTELISDTVIDVGEAVVDTVGKAVTSAVDTVKNVAASAKNLISDAVGGIKSWISKPKPIWANLF